MTIESQMEKVLEVRVGVLVEVTLRGTRNDHLHFTISGNQNDALKAAVFMAKSGLAKITEAITSIEYPEEAFFFMTA